MDQQAEQLYWSVCPQVGGHLTVHTPRHFGCYKQVLVGSIPTLSPHNVDPNNLHSHQHERARADPQRKRQESLLAIIIVI